MPFGPQSTYPPPPPSSRRFPSNEFTFFEDLFVDLTVRIEWLGQVLDSVPPRDASAAALATLQAYAKALADLRVAIQHLQSHAKDRSFSALFGLEGPLAAYLSRLYAWCEEISTDFEALAVGLRREQPVWTVFSHKAVNGSFEHFNALSEAARKDVARVRALGTAAPWDAFTTHLEEVLWATEWLHLSMARKPGD